MFPTTWSFANKVPKVATNVSSSQSQMASTGKARKKIMSKNRMEKKSNNKRKLLPKKGKKNLLKGTFGRKCKQM